MSEEQLIDMEMEVRECVKDFDMIVHLEGMRIGTDEDGDNIELYTCVFNNRYGESEISHSDAFRVCGINHHAARLLPYWSACHQLNKYCKITETAFPIYTVLEEKPVPIGEEYNRQKKIFNEAEKRVHDRRRLKIDKMAKEAWQAEVDEENERLKIEEIRLKRVAEYEKAKKEQEEKARIDALKAEGKYVEEETKVEEMETAGNGDVQGPAAEPENSEAVTEPVIEAKVEAENMETDAAQNGTEKTEKKKDAGEQKDPEEMFAAAEYYQKIMQPPLYRFMNVPFRPTRVLTRCECDGLVVEAKGADPSDAQERAAAAMLRALSTKYTRFLHFYFNWADNEEPKINQAQMGEFVKKN